MHPHFDLTHNFFSKLEETAGDLHFELVIFENNKNSQKTIFQFTLGLHSSSVMPSVSPRGSSSLSEETYSPRMSSASTV